MAKEVSIDELGECGTSSMEVQKHISETVERKRWSFKKRRNGSTVSQAELNRREEWSPVRFYVAEMIEHKAFDAVMGCVIVFNVFLMAYEADQNASCGEPACKHNLVEVLNNVLLGIYTVELLLRFYVRRMTFFANAYNLADLFIVTVGFVDLMVSTWLGEEDVPNIQMLRIFRVLRLIRAVRVVEFFPELYTMVRGFASAMKAMFWGFVMIIILLLIWSILAVEVIYPQYKELAESQDLDESEEKCLVFFSSVTASILLFFQTIVAGDAWGTCALPVIFHSWPTFFIFGGALVSVQMGFTNLILAVVVDRAAEARDADIQKRAQEVQKNKLNGAKELNEIMRRIDLDDSGSITLEELMCGYEVEFDMRVILDLLDIDKKDLIDLFTFMDRDFSGTVDYEEFSNTIQKAMGQDIRVQLMELKMGMAKLTREVHGLADDGDPRPPVSEWREARPAKQPTAAAELSPRHGHKSLQSKGSFSVEVDQSTTDTAVVDLPPGMPATSWTLFAQLEEELKRFRCEMEGHLGLLAQETAARTVAELGLAPGEAHYDVGSTVCDGTVSMSETKACLGAFDACASPRQLPAAKVCDDAALRRGAPRAAGKAVDGSEARVEKIRRAESLRNAAAIQRAREALTGGSDVVADGNGASGLVRPPEREGNVHAHEEGVVASERPQTCMRL